MKDSVIVTGGAGYIGSSVCKAIFREGFLPVAYDNLSKGHEWAVKWGPLEQGDIADKERLTSVIRKYSPVAVIHMAAHAYVGESCMNPSKYYTNNVLATISMINTLYQSGIKNIIFSSSCAIYGTPQTVPITETMEKNPINPYGRTKLIIEKVLEDYSLAYGIQFVCLRYFNAAGADMESMIGEVHDPETHIIPSVFNTIAGIHGAFCVYGDDYETPDGTCIRDYVHVSDIAKAHSAALKYCLDGNESVCVNIGTGSGWSIHEILHSIERISGKKVKRTIGSRRFGDTGVLIADSTYAQNILKWKPHHINLESIIEDAWKWHRHHTCSHPSSYSKKDA